jgi:PhzF family phenazine biosynthesis protein
VSEITVHKVNAFTNNGHGGNGAGVVLDVGSLTPEQMQEIGRLVGYSETAFIQRISDAHFRFRFFSPTDEVDLCGHGTIAACFALLQQGRLPEGVDKFKVDVNVGELSIMLQSDGKISLEMEEPTFGEELDIAEIAKILGVDETAITNTGLKPQVVSVGTRQLIVPISDTDTLNNFQPDIPAMTKFSIEQDTMGMHVFTLTDVPDGADAACRSFDPKNGIDEESATGGACGALGYYLSKYTPPKAEYVFLQGLNMSDPSKLYVAVKPSGTVQVGGFAFETGKEDYGV